MRIPYIPIYSYTLINNEIAVDNLTSMYIGDNKYRVFYGKKKSRDYYDINKLYIEGLQYDMIHLHIVLISFNNNDELKFINKSLSLLEGNLAKEENNLNSFKNMLETENYYCNMQTTVEMVKSTSEKIKNISNKIKLFNKLKGQYNEHN